MGQIDVSDKAIVPDTSCLYSTLKQRGTDGCERKQTALFQRLNLNTVTVSYWTRFIFWDFVRPFSEETRETVLSVSLTLQAVLAHVHPPPRLNLSRCEESPSLTVRWLNILMRYISVTPGPWTLPFDPDELPPVNHVLAVVRRDDVMSSDPLTDEFACSSIFTSWLIDVY